MKKEKPIQCIYNKRERDYASVTCDFDGFPLDVSFPYIILEKANIKEGDMFEWIPIAGREVIVSDLKKIIDNDLPLTEEEEKELEEFLAGGDPIEKFLDKE